MAESKLTKAQRELLTLATQHPSGNPWPLIGMQQRTGGGKFRMFAKMQELGWFDRSNCITEAGRAALQLQGGSEQ